MPNEGDQIGPMEVALGFAKELEAARLQEMDPRCGAIAALLRSHVAAVEEAVKVSPELNTPIDKAWLFYAGAALATGCFPTELQFILGVKAVALHDALILLVKRHRDTEQANKN